MEIKVGFSQLTSEIKTNIDNTKTFNAKANDAVYVHGENGATFYPSVSNVGVISWTNNKGLDNPTPVNIKGKDGANGKDGVNGKDGYTPIKGVDYFDGVKGEKGDTGAQGIQGAKGDKGDKGDTGANGKDGADGYTPIKGKDYFTEADKNEMIAELGNKGYQTEAQVMALINDALGVIENGTY